MYIECKCGNSMYLDEGSEDGVSVWKAEYCNCVYVVQKVCGDD